MKTICFLLSCLWISLNGTSTKKHGLKQIRETGKANWHALELLPSLLANFIVWFIVLLVFFFERIFSRNPTENFGKVCAAAAVGDDVVWRRKMVTLASDHEEEEMSFVANNNTTSSSINYSAEGWKNFHMSQSRVNSWTNRKRGKGAPKLRLRQKIFRDCVLGTDSESSVYPERIDDGWVKKLSRKNVKIMMMHPPSHNSARSFAKLCWCAAWSWSGLWVCWWATCAMYRDRKQVCEKPKSTKEKKNRGEETSSSIIFQLSFKSVAKGEPSAFHKKYYFLSVL